MIKLLIGGSPCTFWSIAQKNNRETKAEGLGWELFENYLIAKEKFKPDFFLYENNQSAAQAIKDQIKKELKVDENDLFSFENSARYIEINSALVSAQNRKRFYVHNCGPVKQPEDRHISVNDVLCVEDYKSYNGGELIRKKPDLTKKSDSMYMLGATNKQCSIGCRVYDVLGKAKTVCANGGGAGAKAGLYLVNGEIKRPSRTGVEKLQTMPIGYTNAVSEQKGISALGNGWTAEVIIHILNGAFKDIPKDEEIIVLSMYDGIGTGRYCLDKMGFTNVKYYAYEIDEYAMKIAKSNYPDILEMGDAFQLREPEWSLL